MSGKHNAFVTVGLTSVAAVQAWKERLSQVLPALHTLREPDPMMVASGDPKVGAHGCSGDPGLGATGA